MGCHNTIIFSAINRSVTARRPQATPHHRTLQRRQGGGKEGVPTDKALGAATHLVACRVTRATTRWGQDMPKQLGPDTIAAGYRIAADPEYGAICPPSTGRFEGLEQPGAGEHEDDLIANLDQTLRPTEPAPLCRYEELARRENRLREALRQSQD